LEHVAQDLEIGAHMFFNVPLDDDEVRLGEQILAEQNVEEAIEWLRVNRLLHANPSTPIEAREWFAYRAEQLVGLRTPAQWWRDKKQERETRAFNKIVNLQEEKKKTKFWQFGKRRKLRRQQRKALRWI
jgi:hypothetical protein